MRYINKQGLPKTFKRALEYQQEQYSGKNQGKNISVTSLIDDPHIRKLKNQHQDEIVQDVSDMIWALFGSAFHHIMETGAKSDDVVEKRLSYVFKGWNINGAFDLLNDDIIYDYKVTSAWSIVYGDKIEDWKQQLNIYRWLAHKNNIYSKGIANVLIFRDWSKSKAERNSDYPDSQVKVLHHDTMDFSEVEELVKYHIGLHNNADNVDKCLPKNRWYRPGKIAIHKPLKSGNGYYKKASKLFDEDEEEYAKQWADSRYDDYDIQYREGSNPRCEDYCEVAEFCSFYQDNIQDND